VYEELAVKVNAKALTQYGGSYEAHSQGWQRG
jgi:hypothetical protein